MVGPLSAALGAEVTGVRPISGGDLNDAARAELADGTPVFVKSSATAAPGAFEAEAAGLRWLADAGALRVPEVLAVGKTFLALEWIDAGPADDEALGRGLALLHGAGADAFGVVAPGSPDPAALLLGPLALPAGPRTDAGSWIAEQRWLPLAQMADERGALPRGARDAIEAVAAHADDLLGVGEPPARLHGDLWSGNVMADTSGAPVLIDPAAHGGPREVDLAMLVLFGGPSERCFAAYDEVLPRPDEHEERVALHQLTPLLVHAVLFGGGYGARAAQVASRYGGGR